ncbi:MAG: hypothetical protein AB1724_09855 [Thermodesulfobacteriota bacterium]
MKIGMIIGALVNLLAGAGMMALAFMLRHNLGAFIGLGVGGLACVVVGVVLLAGTLRPGSLLGLDDPLLTTGIPATAVIRAVQETGISIQHGMYIVMKFNLDVAQETGPPYPVTVKSTVPRISLGMVGPGKTVAVKVDPSDRNHVFIDWRSVPA